MNNLALSEATPVGFPVYTLEGYDPEGGEITFGLVGSDNFMVNPKTGEVKVVKALDREVGNRCCGEIRHHTRRISLKTIIALFAKANHFHPSPPPLRQNRSFSHSKASDILALKHIHTRNRTHSTTLWWCIFRPARVVEHIMWEKWIIIYNIYFNSSSLVASALCSGKRSIFERSHWTNFLHVIQLTSVKRHIFLFLTFYKW